LSGYFKPILEPASLIAIDLGGDDSVFYSSSLSSSSSRATSSILTAGFGPASSSASPPSRFSSGSALYFISLLYFESDSATRYSYVSARFSLFC